MVDQVPNIHLEIRDRILNQIPATIQSILQQYTSSPIRILGDMPNSLLDPENYLASIHPFVSKTENAIHDSRPDIQTRFVAANIYPGKHSYFALDVNNLNYDYETAHTDTTLVPVYHLRLSKRKISITRQPVLDATVAGRLREMHNGHGHDPLPLLDDFTRMMEYRNPRSYRP